jgi:VanZ family protein
VAVIFRGTANLVYAVVLLLGGVAPNPPAISQIVSDTTLHGVAYLIQTLLLFWLARASLATVPALASAALCAAAYSTVVELCQLLQPARSFEVRDLAANFVGVVIACAVVLIAGAATRRR